MNCSLIAIAAIRRTPCPYNDMVLFARTVLMWFSLGSVERDRGLVAHA